MTSHETEPAAFAPWVTKAAFPLLSASFFATQGVLALVVLKGWWWAAIPLILLLSHLMHGFLIAFHEASHGLLRRSKFLNDLDGILIGFNSFTSFTLYRALHQKHHVNLATEKDVELWPFVDPSQPLWWRRLAAFLELHFGLFYSPFLFWRVFFIKKSPITNRRVRARIWAELLGCLAFWVGAVALAGLFGVWILLLTNYFIPAFLAGNLQSWRKYIEHVGLSGHTARSATRSIVADSWTGRFVSLTLLHEPLHGIHHIKSAIPHSQLPAHTAWLTPSSADDTTPFPNYRSAFLDLLSCLHDPRVGRQWEHHIQPVPTDHAPATET